MLVLFTLLTLSFLFGCTESNTSITPPFSESQFYSRVTDLNYLQVKAGDFNSKFAGWDGNKLTAMDFKTQDINTGFYNIDTNWVYANVVWADQNRGYGIMYCVDGNIVTGYLVGFTC